jgi:hypothetical protein
VVVLEENHSFQQVTGNYVMSYLNSLASQFGLATFPARLKACPFKTVAHALKLL